MPERHPSIIAAEDRLRRAWDELQDAFRAYLAELAIREREIEQKADAQHALRTWPARKPRRIP